MLFNSFAFLLVFLPCALLVQAAVERFAEGWRLHSLLALSFLFYGYWDWRFVPLLAGSILANWLVARGLGRARARWLLAASIAGNLAVLALFKYLAFLMQASNLLGLFAVTPMSLALPLGISFFTFHHIMVQTDLRAGRAPPLSLLRYGLYIAFFPQVLAGPLVRWREIVHQFDHRCFRAGFEERMGRGLILLAIGLAKKVFVGDPLATVAAPAFETARTGVLSAGAAWEGLAAFTLQIYFDFSGYTDMALGIALLFGFVLPQNFAVPYRATSIAEFWRRWHMTLSRFLRDYLYIPLGGNRHGLLRQAAALLATMALGGLWHGAGVPFLVWGVVQGAGLVTHLLWRRAGGRMPGWAGLVATMLFVMLGWVLFRAQTFAAVSNYYASLFGMGGLGRMHDVPALVAAALAATVGPTAWDVSQRVRPSRPLAAAAAVALLAALLQIGDEASYEFIYFKF